MSKLQPGYSEHIFRPVYEVNQSAIWIGGAIATPMMSYLFDGNGQFGISGYIMGGMLVAGAHYAKKAYPLLKRQSSLANNKLMFIDVKELRKMNKFDERMSGKLKPKDDPKRTYIGEGFVWGSEHVKRAYMVMEMDSQLSEVQIPYILRPFLVHDKEETEKLGGKPWIHGMGNEKPITTHVENWYGHTLITGNVGTGKTTLLRMLTLNAIHQGNVLIVIDPKNDHDWKMSIKEEYRYMGKEDCFYHFNPAVGSKSCRIPILKHYNRITEVAERIAPLMGSGSGDGAAFENFAYGKIYQAAHAMHYLGEPIRLTTIQKSLSIDREGLGYRVFDRYFTNIYGEGWRERIWDNMKSLHESGDELRCMLEYYKHVTKKDHPSQVVEDVMELSLHNEMHYEKMVASLMPVFTALNAQPLSDLLSPIDIEDMRRSPESILVDVSDEENHKETSGKIVDMRHIMEKGGCIYISLDSMTDGRAASFVARLIQAEISAVAGDRYNTEDKNVRRVSIFNDEAHAAIENNDALLNALAQGRAASLEMFLATQTISDLVQKTDEATASRFLGLCNNFISMRTTDPKTQEYVVSQFAKSSVDQIQVQKGNSNDTSSSILDFGSSHGERIQSIREDAFPGDLLGQLPKLQYIGRLADGRRLKMRLPVVTNDNPDEVAPWAM